MASRHLSPLFRPPCPLSALTAATLLRPHRGWTPTLQGQGCSPKKGKHGPLAALLCPAEPFPHETRSWLKSVIPVTGWCDRLPLEHFRWKPLPLAGSSVVHYPWISGAGLQVPAL